MRLSECIKGQTLIIKNNNIQDLKLKKYTMDIGLINNTLLKIIKSSNPIILKCRNCNLCISKDIAYDIICEAI